MARAAREIAVARRTQSPRSWHANYGTKQGPPSALPRCPRCPRCEGPRRVAAELTASDRLQTLRGCDTRIQQGPKHRTHLLPGTDRGQPFFFRRLNDPRAARAAGSTSSSKPRVCTAHSMVSTMSALGAKGEKAEQALHAELCDTAQVRSGLEHTRSHYVFQIQLHSSFHSSSTDRRESMSPAQKFRGAHRQLAAESSRPSARVLAEENHASSLTKKTAPSA